MATKTNKAKPRGRKSPKAAAQSNGKSNGTRNGAGVPEVHIGEKVRSLRKKKGHSIQKLAELSGVSPAGIYKIETNGMVPTVTTLVKLANALGQKVSYFVEEEDALPEVRLIHKAERTTIASGQDGVTEMVAERLREGRLETFFRTLEAGARCRNGYVKKGGEHFIFCLKGEVGVKRGDETFRLKEGDSLHYQANGKVFFENEGRSLAQFLIVNADDPQG